MTDLSDELQRLRRTQGNPSYRELAQRSGGTFGTSTVHSVMAGRTLRPSWDVVVAICEAMNVTPRVVRQQWEVLSGIASARTRRASRIPATLGELTDILEDVQVLLRRTAGRRRRIAGERALGGIRTRTDTRF